MRNARQLERIAVTEPRARLLGGGSGLEGNEGSLDEWARALRDIADAAAVAGGQQSASATADKDKEPLRGRRGKVGEAGAAHAAEAPAAASLARAAGARVAALTSALAALRDDFEEVRFNAHSALIHAHTDSRRARNNATTGPRQRGAGCG
jgi:hypothetical protein